MKEIITEPQVYDMGHGYGILADIDNCTLKDVLDFFENSKTWGIITVYSERGEIIRKFDYSVDYDVKDKNKEFYHNFYSWDYSSQVKKVKFMYCYCRREIEIYL